VSNDEGSELEGRPTRSRGRHPELFHIEWRRGIRSFGVSIAVCYPASAFQWKGKKAGKLLAKKKQRRSTGVRLKRADASTGVISPLTRLAFLFTTAIVLDKSFHLVSCGSFTFGRDGPRRQTPGSDLLAKKGRAGIVKGTVFLWADRRVSMRQLAACFRRARAGGRNRAGVRDQRGAADTYQRKETSEQGRT